MTHNVQVIGKVLSPYRQKFAIPRQPGLVPAAHASIQLTDEFAHPDCTRGLLEFSHIWVLFVFHETQAAGWKPLVRPPRLGGNERIGVFATRSTFRPNAIGMSVVALKNVRHESGVTYIDIEGADLLDQTPVIDIKPYIPYADSIANATGGFAEHAPLAQFTTSYSAAAQSQLQALETSYPQLALLIEQVLAQDPRPAYKKQNPEDREYGMSLYDLNVRWQVRGQENHVISISKAF